MSDETWPDPAVPYDYPARTLGNESRWKEAVAAALEDKTLELVGTGGDTYDLIGRCPRCGHEICQAIEFDVITSVLPLESRFGMFGVRCNCTAAHDGRDDDHQGCGWGGSIPVPLYIR